MLVLFSLLTFATEATPDPAPDSTPGALPCAQGDCADGVEWKQVEPRRMVMPSFPKAGEGASATCSVRFQNNAKGRPESATATRSESCTEPFALAAEAAAMKWRFKKVKFEGEAVRTAFVVDFNITP